ncbi:3D domain-containing protein [Oceanobacillus bengalensis]|uniref:LysM peptidoglycan-binding domain-containing protein n=1 Tax=Oceanobacillus bengalensis TaxID=1435466 RepID=A0A494Z1K3_9BACI|nr:3D domain-containing protein [Oceanobacillus bengalensis]RKQ15869.1 LysM peptidoglycan-binding domain-containing protein [Oceanobacillus bengalensis]
MKKVFTALLAGVFIISTAAITVSAEEYEIQKGDNLWDIAEDNQTSVDALMEINDLKSTVVHPKQIILLNEQYIVEQADTLEGIAEKYSVTVDEIKRWNNLTSDIIVIGQVLEIKSVSDEQVSDSIGKTNSTASKVDTETEEVTSKESREGKTIEVAATAYTASCEGCSGITYTGLDLNKNPNAKVIAVDPNVIPMGSEVYVEGYGYATAADIGSAIKGNKIDVFVPTLSEAEKWGTRSLEVTILE